MLSRWIPPKDADEKDQAEEAKATVKKGQDQRNFLQTITIILMDDHKTMVIVMCHHRRHEKKRMEMGSTIERNAREDERIEIIADRSKRLFRPQYLSVIDGLVTVNQRNKTMPRQRWQRALDKHCNGKRFIREFLLKVKREY